MTATLQPAEFITPGAEPPPVIVPNRSAVFADRARRFEALAAGHALGDWLRLMGALSRAQHAALQAFPSVPVPLASRSLAHGMPPLLAQSWPRHQVWRDALTPLLDACMAQAPPAGAQALQALRAVPAEQIEALADQVLRTELYGEHAAALPWVAAALQVYWTHMAIVLGAEGIAPIDVPGVCPCCGFLPVASVVRIGEVSGLRYLHCALCNTEWNCVRITCTSCAANDRVAYRQIAGSDASPAVRAETCDACMSYLKILYQDKAPEADPVADDLATLALDLLVDAAGYARSGPNLLFVPGGV